MIGYVTVGTNDLPRAAKFYDALAAEMETPRMMEFETFIAWGKPGGAAGIAATKPFDGNAASRQAASEPDFELALCLGNFISLRSHQIPAYYLSNGALELDN